MIDPFIIDNNFLSDIERNEIIIKVRALEHHWTTLFTNNENGIVCRMLPAGMYSSKYNREGVHNSNMLMLENFSSLYEKVQNRLQLYYQRPITFHTNLQFPGFHIFPNYYSYSISYNLINFHRDIFQDIVGEVVSVVVPIKLPATGASLLFNDIRNTMAIRPHFQLPMDTDQRFVYGEGMMAAWPGNLQHCMAPFKLASEEFRMTLQMHVNLTEDRGTIFW